jgi:hypothetical protein
MWVWTPALGCRAASTVGRGGWAPRPPSAPQIDGQAVRRGHPRTVAHGMRAVVSGVVMEVTDTPSASGGGAAPRVDG